MTYLYDDPAAFAEDALAGLCDAYSHLLQQVPGGVIRRDPGPAKVAVLYCGGSGHYPAFAGIVGPGMGHGAVCGNIFTSPSADDAVSVARAADTGHGVVFTYGNYAGDVMNFALATERLRAEGHVVHNVIVTDDIASAPPEETQARRGIAGDFTVFKVMGAAAERGDDVEQVVALGHRANDATRTIGVALSGCTLPGAQAPLFLLPPGEMGLGLGIHGEPGLADVPLPRAADLAQILVDRILAERPDPAAMRAAVILNGLGSTKYEELFVLWRTVAALLREQRIGVVAPEVGELVTSLDMAGVSLTLMFLDDELQELWVAPALTPAFTRTGLAAPTTADPSPRDAQPSTRPANPSADDAAPVTTPAEPAGPGNRAAAQVGLHLLGLAHRALAEAETELGRLDSVAGDGDHGRGMVRGCAAAVRAASSQDERQAGVQDLLAAAGDAWAAQAGGTSGVLWGSALRAAGERLGNRNDILPTDLADAADAFVTRLRALGKAELGDKTMLDAAIPFAATLRNELGHDPDVGAALAQAFASAEQAAHDTAQLTPRIGRARPLAAKSLGTPDPGAVSLALILGAVTGQPSTPTTQNGMMS